MNILYQQNFDRSFFLNIQINLSLIIEFLDFIRFFKQNLINLDCKNNSFNPIFDLFKCYLN